ncbi:hypothetical protein [Pseudomonas sp. MYb185]|uniref:hypothetical protein n=1 Tax=Pseudomonas sp. MYb185 TaxID=1848729 RepID=UPI000CFDB6B3|nr:hypothetical protein [Pseudomonas sp. MYb185]PRB84668.1 hypothetical protein CQ007_02545 [Pseudomonas sp. MYb185]
MSEQNEMSRETWGFIDKRDRSSEAQIWLGVEPCYSQAQGEARAAELEAADPSHEYRAEPYLEPSVRSGRHLSPRS